MPDIQKNDPLTAEELTINARLLYNRIQEMYAIPEGDRTSEFWPELSNLWAEFRVVSGDLVRALISQGKL